MSQSLIQNYIHLVFSTKHRKPLINEHIEDDLFAYIGGTLNKLDCKTICVGGYLNHVHIFCRLSKAICLMDLVKAVKTNSSKWIKSKGVLYKDFYWQDGYGAFSVGPEQVETLRKYIQNQKTHHQRRSFEAEFRIFLDRYSIDYDERYFLG
jgi:REP element-mobilizing transposase RayT